MFEVIEWFVFIIGLILITIGAEGSINVYSYERIRHVVEAIEFI